VRGLNLLLLLEAFFGIVCLRKDQLMHLYLRTDESQVQLSVVRKRHVHVPAICTAAVKQLHPPPCFGPCFSCRPC